MSLPYGLYTIRTTTRTNAPVGRHFVEDRSLLPKRVLLLPSSTAGTDHALWRIIPSDDGLHELQVLGGSGIEKNDMVFADILRSSPPTEWRLEKQESGKYTIISGRTGSSWVFTKDEQFSQVSVQPLRGEPRPENLFEIVLFEADD